MTPELPSLDVRVRMPLDRFALDVAFRTTARVTGLFGHSGAGKTSLLETIAGLRRAPEARVALAEDVWQDSASGAWVPPEGRRIGFVPQDGLLFPHLDVRGNLLAASASRRGGEGVRAVLDSVVEVLELAPLLERDVTSLSGGERQRVALGRAICSGPSLLLLDEPLAGLDLPLQRRILPFLLKVRELCPAPLLVVSHDPTLVQVLCDDLVVLHEGRLRARGEPRRVLTDPAVFPIAEEEGFQNVLPCRLPPGEAVPARTVRLGRAGQGPELRVHAVPEGAAGEALVSVPASDILISLEKPAGLSARNILPAVVASLDDVGAMRIVRCALAPGLPEIASEVTPEASAELGLVPGLRVHLIIKSAACTVFRG